MTAEIPSLSMISDEKEETLRTERVPKARLSNVSIPLSCGGEIRLSVLEDVEEYVGEIQRRNDFRVTESGDYYRITVYRTKRVCEKSGCHSTADSKFDGNWLCESHLSSYTAQYIG